MTDNQDGWLEWKGGDRPVAETIPVEVRLRAYAGSVHLQAKALRWWHGPVGDPHDIVAYRIVNP